MHTDYPGLAARAGDNVTFSIEFDNSGSACDASLSIQSMPKAGRDTYPEAGTASAGFMYLRVPIPPPLPSSLISLRTPRTAATRSFWRQEQMTPYMIP